MRSFVLSSCLSVRLCILFMDLRVLMQIRNQRKWKWIYESLSISVVVSTYAGVVVCRSVVVKPAVVVDKLGLQRTVCIVTQYCSALHRVRTHNSTSRLQTQRVSGRPPGPNWIGFRSRKTGMDCPKALIQASSSTSALFRFRLNTESVACNFAWGLRRISDIFYNNFSTVYVLLPPPTKLRRYCDMK